MSSTPTTLNKLTVTRSRPSAGPIQSNSPHTPLSRSVSGLYGSPGSSFRIDDENLLIFEFGTRQLRAGFAGECAPRGCLKYTPDSWRRVGDYRQWELGYDEKGRNLSGNWGEGYELWSLDLRDADLGLIEDRIEKLVREVESKYLLLDNRGKKVTLVAPSGLPRPLLNIVIRSLFEALQAAAVTVVPNSIMATVGAGVRSALVVDVGWFETTASAVYEYREIQQTRSVRAGKLLTQEFALFIHKEMQKLGLGEGKEIIFQEAEEIVRRMAWCKDVQQSGDDTSEDDPTTITISLSESDSVSKSELQIAFSALAEPTETALFAKDFEFKKIDDNELPLHHLVYNALLQLPADVRSLCVSNIIFTGGASEIPGLKRRILHELQALIDSKGWDHIHHYAPRIGISRSMSRPAPLAETSGNARPPSTPPKKVTESTNSVHPEPATPTTPAHARAHDTNPIDVKLASLSLKDAPPSFAKGHVRAIRSLGSWAGASLLTNLRIKGAVEIEKERFMSHGLVGGAIVGSGKPGATVAQEAYSRTRQSLGANAKLGTEKGTGWSLGVWS